MQNYETLIMEALLGGSPKDKYEYLKSLEAENSNLAVKVSLCKTLVDGLNAAPDNTEIGSIRPFITGVSERI